MHKSALTILIVTAHECPFDRVRWERNEYGLGAETPFATYRSHANSLQRDFDNDGDPSRAYVCRDGVPTFAALMPPELEDPPRGQR